MERPRAELSEATRRKSTPPFARPVGPFRQAIVLALDDVVDLQHLGLTRLDSNVLQHRHQLLAEGVELLARVPDLADSELAVGLEGDMVLESLGRPVARLLPPADGVVVLFRGTVLAR